MPADLNMQVLRPKTGRYGDIAHVAIKAHGDNKNEKRCVA